MKKFLITLLIILFYPALLVIKKLWMPHDLKIISYAIRYLEKE